MVNEQFYQLRQGDTTTILITFDQSIGDNDLKVCVYDTDKNVIFSSLLSQGEITALGNNTYRVIINYDVTINFVGKYYLDLLLKSPNDKSYVNTGEEPIKLIFKDSVIAKNI